MRRIAALVPNVLGVAPGQRVRIETWAPHLRPHGWDVDFYPFEDQHLREILYQPGRLLTKTAGLLRCYLRQLRTVLQGPACDVLLIHREAALVGPAFLERLAARKKVPVVYDVDDPVFLPYRSPMNGWFSLLKFPRKTHSLFRLSNHVITINGLLAEYAAHYNRSVTVIPNCVDLERYRPVPRQERDHMRLVWIGSHSTMPNLAAVQEPIRRLQSTHQAPLRLIGAGEPDLPGIDLEVRQWSAATEVRDLQDCDVGLVPLPDLPWNRWKFFFKTIQYMAAGLPVVAHRMGSNSEVIRHGVSGFLADTPDEWHAHLLTLARDPALRRRMGEAARKDVEEQYSVQTQMPRLASVFDRVAGQYRT